MSARVLGLTLLFAATAILAGAPAARAETWACYDPRHPKAAPTFSNAKKKGMRCVLFSASQPWPGSARKGDGDDPAGAAGGASAFGREQGFAPPPPGAGGAADEPAEREGRERLYAAYVEEAARLYDLPEAFLSAIIRVESSFKYRAVSPVGAQGLMQLMPGTAREMGVSDPFDPRQNVLGGARLVRLLANRYKGNMVQVLSAYCSGSGAVKKADGALPSEAAEGYVRAVLDHYYQYKALGGP